MFEIKISLKTEVMLEKNTHLEEEEMKLGKQ